MQFIFFLVGGGRWEANKVYYGRCENGDWSLLCTKPFELVNTTKNHRHRCWVGGQVLLSGESSRLPQMWLPEMCAKTKTSKNPWTETLPPTPILKHELFWNLIRCETPKTMLKKSREFGGEKLVGHYFWQCIFYLCRTLVMKFGTSLPKNCTKRKIYLNFP